MTGGLCRLELCHKAVVARSCIDQKGVQVWTISGHTVKSLAHANCQLESEGPL